jgi:poly(beta-D-mannuronate) lyase
VVRHSIAAVDMKKNTFAFGCKLTLLLLIVSTGFAKTYRVKSAGELENIRLKAGDTVLLQNGVWQDQKLLLKGAGTSEHPIVLRAETAGNVLLKGTSSLTISGQWLVVDGLYFKEGVGEKHVVVFSDSAAWCRLTNSAIVNYNPSDKKSDSHYVSMNGIHNRVDHCFFEGKTNHGPTLVVWLSDKPNYHRIDHNHFGFRPPLGENGGESIRIGTSTWSLYNSYTTVEYNLFEHCDGEMEIISNKSCHNTIRYNTFFESKGTLTLRHGNDAVVYGNFFIGNNVEKTGGIRIIGEDHVVFGNHFQDLEGTGLSAAISIMDGLPNSPLTGYYQVKNAQVIDNTIVRCAEAFSIGAGKNETRNLKPLNSSITANHIVPGESVIKFYDEVPLLHIENNVLYQKDSIEVPLGFSTVNPDKCKNLPGMKNLSANAPPLVHRDVGCSWRERQK